ncbi:MAG: GIY-YIG nuclease family protein [Candidatus Neomarinimicrobiota bacterium]
MKSYYVYILSNKMRTTLYIGVTNDIERRMFEHKSAHGSKFCKKYKVYDLLYYEEYPLVVDAIGREKQLKNWHQEWKWNLIKKNNKHLQDISKDWFSREDYENIKKCKKMKILDEYYREA